MRRLLLASLALAVLGTAALASSASAALSCSPQPGLEVRPDRMTRLNVSCGGIGVGAFVHAVLMQPPSHGTMTWSPTAPVTFDYTPDPGYTGPDAFSFRGATSSETTPEVVQSLVVTASANHDPVCMVPRPVVVRQGSPKRLEFDCFDTDDDPIMFSPTSTPTKGTLSAPLATSVIYTTTSPTGADSFGVRVTDDHGGSSFVVTQPINAVDAAYNTAPHCTDASLTVRAGEAPFFTPFYCYDEEGDPVTILVTQAPTQGAALPPSTPMDGQAWVYYRANASAVGADQFRYAASDGHLTGLPATAMLTILPALGGGAGGGGGGSGSAASTVPPPAPSTDPAPAPTPAPITPRPTPTPSPARAMPEVPGLDLGDATARLTADSDGKTIPVSGGHTAKLMTLECVTGCTADATIEFVLPGASGRAAAAKVIRGARQRLKLAPGKRGTVTLRVPASVRKHVKPNATIKVRVTITVHHADGRTDTDTTTFKVKLKR